MTAPPATREAHPHRVAACLAWVRDRPGVFWLGLVAVGFAVTQVVLVPLDTYLSWDEAVYAGEFAVPNTVPSPHRALGPALLVAPVTAVTSSVVVVRTYLTVLSAVGLFLAYRTWLAVDSRVAPLAALLFAVAQALRLAHLVGPNLATALTAVAAVGFFVRAGEAMPRWRSLVGLAGALGGMALMRPTDAVFLSVALYGGIIAAPRWRRPDLAVAVFAGLGVGGVAWLVEAYVRFGGPLRRLSDMRAITDTGRPSIAAQWLAALASRVSESPAAAVAVAVAAVMAVVLAVVAVRVVSRRVAARWTLTLGVAATLIAAYHLLLSWVAERYFLPAQALLLLVAAAALVRIAAAGSGTTKRVTAGLATAAVLLYLGLQLPVSAAKAAGAVEIRQARQGHVDRLRAHGIAPPCLVTGDQAPALAHGLGCGAGDLLTAFPIGGNRYREMRRDLRQARGDDVVLVVVLVGERPPADVADWDRIRLDRGRPLYAYVSP